MLVDWELTSSSGLRLGQKVSSGFFVRIMVVCLLTMTTFAAGVGKYQVENEMKKKPLCLAPSEMKTIQIELGGGGKKVKLSSAKMGNDISFHVLES